MPFASALGPVLALAFTVTMVGLFWWMLHVPPVIPYEVARVVRSLEAAERILIPVVDSEYSRRAVELAARLVQGRKAELILVYVLEIPLTLPLGAPLPAAEARAASVLEQAGKIPAYHHLPYRTRILRARSAGAGIIHALQEEKADLIVLGLRPHREGYNPLGRTAEWLLRRCPVEIVFDRYPG